MFSSFVLWLLRLLGVALFAAGLLLVNHFAFPHLNEYYQEIALGAGIAVILAVSLNLINGITGQFSLGHVGFAAIGAYVSAFFTKEIGQHIVGNADAIQPLNFALGIVAGALAAALAGLLVGLPSLRLRGDYLAIVTLGFNQIVVTLLTNLDFDADKYPRLPHGPTGYSDIPQFTNFLWVASLVALCILSIRNLSTSRLGRAMRAVRDDEIAAEAAGINTTQVKIVAFVFSSLWAGVAGALTAHLQDTISPVNFEFTRSIDVVIAVVLGGLGSTTGAALAGGLLKVLEEVLREVRGVYWTSLGLIALATYWGFQANRERIRCGFGGVVVWLRGPLLGLALTLYLYYYQFNWLSTRTGPLRYVLYSIILIVLMLLRPQGLFGRAEWSLAALRGRSRRSNALS